MAGDPGSPSEESSEVMGIQAEVLNKITYTDSANIEHVVQTLMGLVSLKDFFKRL